MHIFYTNKKKYTPQCGFTLVELMVSIALFAIVMVISVGTLLVLVEANTKAQSMHTVMSNLSFAVDAISRNIRTGNEYHCNTATTGGNDSLPTGARDCTSEDAIYFSRGIDDVRTGYRLNGNVIQMKRNDLPTTSWLDVTSANVVVTDFTVSVSGSTGGDGVQPHVTLFVEGYVLNGLDTDTDFTLQSNITQRSLDF